MRERKEGRGGEGDLICRRLVGKVNTYYAVVKVLLCGPHLDRDTEALQDLGTAYTKNV